MQVLFAFCSLLLTLPVAAALDACAADGKKSCADSGDNVPVTATNSIIQGRVDALAGVELKVHPNSDVAKMGHGEWIITPVGGCGQEELQTLVENMPNNTRAVIHGQPEKGGLCFFVMEGTREGVWQKLAMHRWKSPPKVETDTPLYIDAHLSQESATRADRRRRYDRRRYYAPLATPLPTPPPTPPLSESSKTKSSSSKSSSKASVAVPWGLDRIDDRRGADKGGLDGSFKPMGTSGGSGVHVYVFDTGIRTSHDEFGGRAVPELDTSGDVPRECKDKGCAVDNEGHGTFCAAIIGGRTVGVAPHTTLHAVKVLDGEEGKAMSLHVAFDRVLSQNLVCATTIFSVSLSLDNICGAIHVAMREMTERGVTVVVAAGNDDSKHNTVSGGFLTQITVAATDRHDKKWKHNGKFEDIFAPGVNIMSALSDSDSKYGERTGTSAAAPHVAGAAAILLSEAKTKGVTFPNPTKVYDALKHIGTVWDRLPWDKLLFIGDYDSSNGWMSEFVSEGRDGKQTGIEPLPFPSHSEDEVKIVLR